MRYCNLCFFLPFVQVEETKFNNYNTTDHEIAYAGTFSPMRSIQIICRYIMETRKLACAYIPVRTAYTSKNNSKAQNLALHTPQTR